MKLDSQEYAPPDPAKIDADSPRRSTTGRAPWRRPEKIRQAVQKVGPVLEKVKQELGIGGVCRTGRIIRPLPGRTATHGGWPRLACTNEPIGKEPISMRHYEIVFIVHPDQSEQVPGDGRALQGRHRARATARCTASRTGAAASSPTRSPKVHKAHYVLMNIECDNETLDRARALVQVQRRRAAPPHRQDGQGA